MYSQAFIVGNARSGSCWLGQIFRSHPDVECDVERDPQFGLATQLATRGFHAGRMGHLIRAYEQRLAKVSKGKLYADKSHPALFVASCLAGAFPDACFVAIHREPYGSVASMIEHQGVLAWQRKIWSELPTPNAFLGLAGDEVPYDCLSDAKRAALRWASHEWARGKLMADRTIHVDYDALCSDPEGQCARVQAFLGLERPFPTPTPRRKRGPVSAKLRREVDGGIVLFRETWPQ